MDGKTQKLTTAKVRALAPGHKEYNLADYGPDAVRGLQVRVWASGRKVYSVMYRVKGKRRRYTIGEADLLTLQQARAEAKAVLGRVVRGEDPEADKVEQRKEVEKAVTFGQFLDEHYGPWVLANRKAGHNTLTRLRTSFKAILDKRLDAVTAWEVERWRSARVKKAGRKDAGSRDLAALKACMGKAVAWGQLDQNPLDSVKPNRRDKAKARVPRVLTKDEECALFATLDVLEEEARTARRSANAWRTERGYEPLEDLDQAPFVDYTRPLLTVLLYCGLRRGEALGIRWEHIDLERAQLTVPGDLAKSGQTRVLPLADHVRDTLAKWHAQTGGRPDDYVFSSPKTGDRFDNFKKRWRTVFNRAGIEGVTPHSLRHTFCSRLIQAGADLESVRRLAGHSSIAVTAIYLHGDAQTDRNAMALLKPPTDGGDNIVAFPGAVNASED